MDRESDEEEVFCKRTSRPSTKESPFVTNVPPVPGPTTAETTGPFSLGNPERPQSTSSHSGIELHDLASRIARHLTPQWGATPGSSPKPASDRSRSPRHGDSKHGESKDGLHVNSGNEEKHHEYHEVHHEDQCENFLCNKQDDPPHGSHAPPPTEQDSSHHHMDNVNDSAEETAILQDLERKGGFGALGKNGTIADFAGFVKGSTLGATSNASMAAPGLADRNRSASMISATMDLINRVRNRKNSQDSMEFIGFEEFNGHRLSGWRYYWYCVIFVIKYLTPGFERRMNVYCAILFLVVISMVAKTFAPAQRLLLLYICSVGLEFLCSMIDRVLFKLIDVVFASRFDIAYQLHSLNGPFGLLLTVLVMRTNWQILGAQEVFSGWDSLITASTVIIICLAGKNWLTRKQYVYLLENRFVSKVESLNTMIIILSELASTRPPKSVQLKRATSNHHLPTTSKTEAGVTKLKNVFEDSVDPNAGENTEDNITRKELYQKRRSFWQSAARLNSTAGSMQVITYNGIVIINNQEQAKAFGKKLYKHLSKSGKVIVTPELLQKLFEERREAVTHDEEEKYHHDLEMSRIANKPASEALKEHAEEKQELWSVAVGLLDPFNLGKVNEDFCVEAVLNIYKEQRFTAASINDFGELHQSLRIGIDIVYWIVMLFVLQAIFGFDLTSYLLPFITLLLTFSFAIAPLVGNIFLAFAFVFFMSPYEVGHKVQFGLFNVYTPPIIGFIKSVTLLYTVVNTGKNETVKIPNHTLYSERIYNLTETTGAVYEFTFCFNVFGASHTDMDKIRIFFQRLKHYTLRESKEWKSFLVSANNMDTLNNSMEYKVFCVHREGWGFYQAATAAKIEYYAKIKQLREEMGITFMKFDQPVSLTNFPGLPPPGAGTAATTGSTAGTGAGVSIDSNMQPALRQRAVSRDHAERPPTPPPQVSAIPSVAAPERKKDQ